MKKKIDLPENLVRTIAKIVKAQRYTALQEVFTSADQDTLFVDEEEARALLTLVKIEHEKAMLRYPYYDEKHPKFSEEHEDAFLEVQMGIYEKTVYYVESAFDKGTFDDLFA